MFFQHGAAMKRFTFKGVLDNFRQSVSQPTKSEQPELVETLKTEHCQLARVSCVSFTLQSLGNFMPLVVVSLVASLLLPSPGRRLGPKLIFLHFFFCKFPYANYSIVVGSHRISFLLKLEEVTIGRA